MHLILILIITILTGCNKADLIDNLSNKSLEYLNCSGQYSTRPSTTEEVRARFIALKEMSLLDRECVSLQGIDLNNYIEVTTPGEQLLNQSNFNNETEYLTSHFGYDPSTESIESYLARNFGVDSFDCYSYIFKNSKGSVNLFGFTKLSDINFSNVNVSQMIFPRNMNLNGSDFTSVLGLSAKQFNYSFISFSGAVSKISLSNVILPAGFDISLLDLDGRSLKDTDLTQTLGLTVRQIDKAVSYINFKFPLNFNVSNWNLSDKSLNYINFENTIGLSSSQLQVASSYKMTTLPQMNLSNFDMSNKRFHGTDFSNTSGLTQTQIDQAEYIYDIIL